jgi:two-component system, NtrC family, response regulator GlrR
LIAGKVGGANAMTCQRILVVDDDRSVLRAVKEILVKAHYEVETTDDTTTALRLAGSKRFDMAVLDYQMPGIDGVELFRQLHEQQPEMTGVLLTSYPTIDKVFPAVDSGFARILAKPVNAGELLPTAAEFIGPGRNTMSD